MTCRRPLTLAVICTASAAALLLWPAPAIAASQRWRGEWAGQPLHERMSVEERVSAFGDADEPVEPGDYEVVALPLPLATDHNRHYNFTAFGRMLSLRLEPNERLLSQLTLLVRDRHATRQMEAPVTNCHYLHSDGTSTAAFSSCSPDGLMHGWIFLSELTLEVRPLAPRLRRLLAPGHRPGLTPYLVKRAAAPPYVFAADQILLPEDVRMEVEESNMVEEETDFQEDSNPVQDEFVGGVSRRASESSPQQRPVLEVALFFDEAGYRAFAPYLQNDDKQIADMLLAYLNGVQALYHHPSAGRLLDIVLVRLELQKAQPADLPHYGGQASPLLDSFCTYNAKHNPAGDQDDPQHWDMGLYVSGLDFYAVEGGRRSDITMGLSTVGGVCLDKYSCVIAELGATNAMGKPYPSAGFTSVYVLAHEIGHNLGMHHDGSSNQCPSEGFIMSPSRGTAGETLWSPCSAQVMQTLASDKKCLSDRPASIAPERDHARKMHDHPGQLWGAKRQCELLLRDRDAEVRDPARAEGMCQSLECKTPHRSGYYFAGPALEGTVCAKDQWCQGGECVRAAGGQGPEVVKGGWSKWTTEECASGCIAKSKGFHAKHRRCNDPVPVNTEEGCEGPSFDIELCKDDKVCKKKKRIHAADYAKKKCAEFSKTLPVLDPNGSGMQAPHEEGRLWVACSIFCRRTDNGSYYAPRLDLNDIGLDPYFPDGTRCHDNGKHTYYCMNHHCRPEQFRGAKSLLGVEEDWDELAGLVSQNAPPHAQQMPDPLVRYLSLDPDGRPLLTELGPRTSGLAPPPDSDWASHDYLDLPQPM